MSQAAEALTQSSERTGEAAEIQRRAADPAVSAWVGASAGTGKTRVLTDRVLRLMLSGVRPERILCLTFTKAAAAEMSNRLAGRLALWVGLDRTDLEGTLADLLGERAAPEMLDRARQLFARVLDVPGGMKIQTIHSFCQSLLGRFPLEAGVAPHFRLLDERGAGERLREAREAVLARADGPDGRYLAAALSQVSAHVNEQDFAELMQSLVQDRGRLSHAIARSGGVEGLIAALARRLKVDPERGRVALLAAICGEAPSGEALSGEARCGEASPAAPSAAAGFRRDALDRCVAAMRRGGTKDQATAEKLAAWLAAAPAERPALLESYLGAFFTDQGQGARRKSLVFKDSLTLYPEAAEVLAEEAARLEDLRARIKAGILVESTGALLRLGDAILGAYAARKRAEALLDYDDLILECRALLDRQGISPWVLYKLDGGIEHLLIDEAQDTNPDHWRVVERLTEEFFAGETAYEARSSQQGDEERGEPLARTVFAVGDAKQSIYSFQGAQPAEFKTMGGRFQGRAEASERRFAPVDLTHSFRSTDAVLACVDAVFAAPEARDGLTFGEDWLAHRPVRVGQAGRVELWPPAEPPESAPPVPWEPPLRGDASANPRARLASLIARRIAHWTRTEESEEAWLAARGRRIAPGDILVLVRRRNAFVEDLVRELKTRGVPVAGVDRMVLTDQIAVMDLLALGRTLLLPQDDLTLATVLKGPLIDLEESALFELAWNRDGSLWEALRARAAEPAYRHAHAYLTSLADLADFVPPYELFTGVLAQGGRRRLLARLGPDAADAIEEFLGQALVYEREHVPSLEGFLHWLEAGRLEIKRDMEVGARAVRVMTVHGAKGLQAPVVILPDTLTVPMKGPKIFWLEDELPLWSPRVALDDTVAAAAREAARAAQDREYRRLLYVALTRAEDRLYVAGWLGKTKPQEGCWYRLVEQALAKDLAAPVAFDFAEYLPAEQAWAGDGWRLSTSQRAVPKEVGGEATAEPLGGELDLQPWMTLSAPSEEGPPRALAPSRATEVEPPVRSPLGAAGVGGADGREADGARFRRGLLIHRLLQSLPDLPPERRPQAAARFLAQPLHGLAAEDQAEIARETLAVLETPGFAPLFGPGSRAEVPVVGLVEGRQGPQVVFGQLDRIFVGQEKLLIVDFKTNRPPPHTAAEVAPLYLRQLALYKALLSGVYPGREVLCALLWTLDARLMPLDASLLSRHMP